MSSKEDRKSALLELKECFEGKLINQEEYDQEKRRILKKIGGEADDDALDQNFSNGSDGKKE